MTNIEKLLFYFRDQESPIQFLIWDYLYMVSSCLGRKVWFQKNAPVYPNIYVVIVGPPAVGKTMPAKILGDALRGIMVEKTSVSGEKYLTEMVKVAPQCVTLERLYEILARSVESFKYMDKPKIHSSMSFILADEMGLLFKNADQIKNLTNFLNAGYDCMNKFEYETKHGAPNIITNMCVSFFGCCTPAWISKNLDPSSIDEGWASRIFFIYGDKKRQLTTYYEYSPEQLVALDDLKKHFRAIAAVAGEVTFSDEARAYFDQWYQNESEGGRINRDPRMDHYYSRKRIHTWKLAMLAHFAEKTDLVVTLQDMKQAFKWLAEAEVDMHKALASVNSNPVSRLAEEIVRQVMGAGKGKITPRIEIIHKQFSNSPGGLPAIEEAIRFLKMTEKVEEVSGGLKIKEKIISGVDFVGGLSTETETTNTAEVKVN